MKGIFWENYEIGTISGDAIRILDESCNVCLDSTN
jgi:hypothetical protein